MSISSTRSGGGQVEVRWRSGGGLVEVRWRSGGGQVEVRWRSGGGQVEVRWRSGGGQVEVWWRSGGGLVEVRWRSGGGLVEVWWRSGGGLVEVRWRSDGEELHLVFTRSVVESPSEEVSRPRRTLLSSNQDNRANNQLRSSSCTISWLLVRRCNTPAITQAFGYLCG
ncbi:hypothetical protein KUCAC02_032416 [Chaenocephalus aceratus]|nr:hypothetical protein KUCAC02_032416 [Chaenocephalus aceratus]